MNTKRKEQNLTEKEIQDLMTQGAEIAKAIEKEFKPLTKITKKARNFHLG